MRVSKRKAAEAAVAAMLTEIVRPDLQTPNTIAALAADLVKRVNEPSHYSPPLKHLQLPYQFVEKSDVR